MPDSYKFKSHRQYAKDICDKMPSFVKFDAKSFIPNFESDSLGKGVKICLLDTGVADHKSLPTATHMCNLGRSKHGQDHEGHAHVTAGIIAAKDSDTLVGLSPDVKLYFAKCTDDMGSANSDSIAAGLLWAAVNHCHIAVIPHIFDKSHQAIDAAIRKASSSNVVVISETSGVYGPHVLAADQIPLKLDDTLIYSAYTDNRYVGVSKSDFRPAILAALVARMIDHPDMPDNISRLTVIRQELVKLL